MAADKTKVSPSKQAFSVQEARFHGDRVLHPPPAATPAPADYDVTVPRDHTGMRSQFSMQSQAGRR